MIDYLPGISTVSPLKDSVFICIYISSSVQCVVAVGTQKQSELMSKRLNESGVELHFEK